MEPEGGEMEMSEKDRCDNCGYETKTTTFRQLNDEELKFCAVCSSTFLSRATTHPRQYGEQGPLFQSLGYIANMILDELGKVTGGRDDH